MNATGEPRTPTVLNGDIDDVRCAYQESARMQTFAVVEADTVNALQDGNGLQQAAIGVFAPHSRRGWLGRVDQFESGNDAVGQD
jgi:hypothetical protein